MQGERKSRGPYCSADKGPLLLPQDQGVLPEGDNIGAAAERELTRRGDGRRAFRGRNSMCQGVEA